MIKKVIIILNEDEFYDDAQLLARSFFARAVIKRIKEDEDLQNKGFIPVKTVNISSDGCVCTLNMNALVPKAGTGSLTRGQIHDLFKRALYRDISEATGITLPWGFLTGVKPAKRITEILKNNHGISEAAARKRFETMYMVRPDKSRLAYNVAKNEEAILKNLHKENEFSIYVGIPFCPSICDYCSFGSVPITSCDADMVETYMDALCYEIKTTSQIMKNKYDGTGAIYIGGGTPTTLEPRNIRRLLDTLDSCFGLSSVKEITVEAGRPDSFTREKLEVLREYGITRISINPQSMNEETLERIGRRHSEEDVYSAFELARSMGFDNINTDIILALPGEGPADIERTAEKIKELNPDSLTAHSLAIKRAAALDINSVGRVLTREDAEKITATVERLAADLEMKPYYMYRQQNMAGNLENVGYAKEGKESLYNIVIMEEVQDILAFGAGGSSKFLLPGGRIERAVNVKSLKDYIERTDEMIERKRRLL